jgi:hypothetical protein
MDAALLLLLGHPVGDFVHVRTDGLGSADSMTSLPTHLELGRHGEFRLEGDVDLGVVALVVPQILKGGAR